jgi:hypothetical protein
MSSRLVPILRRLRVAIERINISDSNFGVVGKDGAKCIAH